MQLVNNFSVVHGGHSTKLGFDFSHISGNMLFKPGANALYHFATLESYLAREPLQYQQFIGTGDLDLGMNQLAFYVQDQWRPLPGLTLTPGFRYEAQFNPDYLDPTVPEARFPLATSIPDDTTMFAPRLGIAWDIGNNSKTVVRAGGGLFYGATHLGLLAQSVLFNGGNPELASRVLVTNLAGLQEAFSAVGSDLATAPLNQLPTFTASQVADFFGDSGLTQSGAQGSKLKWLTARPPPVGAKRKLLRPEFQKSARFAAQDRKSSMNWLQGFLWERNFTYINTVRSSLQRDLNLGVPVPDATGRPIFSSRDRPYAPDFYNVQITESSARSLYRAFTTTFNVRRSRFTLDTYYTLSWKYSHDDMEQD